MVLLFTIELPSVIRSIMHFHEKHPIIMDPHSLQYAERDIWTYAKGVVSEQPAQSLQADLKRCFRFYVIFLLRVSLCCNKILTLSQTSLVFTCPQNKSFENTEKLLLTSNFSFSHRVFYPFEELSSIFIKFEIVVCKLFQFSFGKGLTHSHTMTPFDAPEKEAF